MPFATHSLQVNYYVSRNTYSCSNVTWLDSHTTCFCGSSSDLGGGTTYVLIRWGAVNFDGGTFAVETPPPHPKEIITCP